MLIALVVLLVLLGAVTREWLTLRSRARQRGLFSRWPVPRVALDQFDLRFVPDDFGPTLGTEVHFIGRGSLRVPGGTTDAEAWILAVLAKDAMEMFEFGTCTGKTAYLWARNQPIGTLTLSPEQLQQYQDAAGDDALAVRYAKQESAFTGFVYNGTPVEAQITQLFGDSKAFDGAPWRDRCDVVFVDGSHAYSYVMSDTWKAMAMVRPGGVVLWHDYNDANPGVFKALNDLVRSHQLVHLTGTDLVAWRRPIA
jgi:hypothetical protein